jgi:hypothetical protein
MKYSGQKCVYSLHSSLVSSDQLFAFPCTALCIPCTAPGKSFAWESKELIMESQGAVQRIDTFLAGIHFRENFQK